ncbi:AbrB/MazE/SpoVT family DNA-binding domain-containing protein [Neobacillus cucumis]|uniref:AbrB/MazE/SpoVT family DNA-binding domain-containing protein n=1 Tax=Neobacillus cucumis TaxID=1740721 RepID=UPI0018DF562B|nr:AbrB/MazE/SpoVT family DNA-binding domain-containing protein [Neobacillus cucumis]MBI0579440.1 AbrB/MazE/SpoVT family DNA-binding domain-containing protein [Neobacillus cucumis]
MKSTGIVRKVDELGRIVVPIELRRSLDIDLKDPIEIFFDGEQIILKKYSPNMACMVTDEVTNENKAFSDGKLILSPKGAEILTKEIKSNFLVRA